jgi:hypothetical protein
VLGGWAGEPLEAIDGVSLVDFLLEKEFSGGRMRCGQEGWGHQ